MSRRKSIAASMIIVACASGCVSGGPPHVPTAFYYGRNMPSEILDEYDRVVIEPDNVPMLPRAHAEPFAYVSLGEVDRSRAYRAEIPPALLIAKNESWNSDIVDVRAPAWRAFVLDRIIEPLWARGLRGFFFDTLDSYTRTTTVAAVRDEHLRGLARIINDVKRRHPSAKVVLNRGFELVPLVAPIDGFVAESLFDGPNGAIAPREREALLRRLKALRVADRRLPIAVIDYIPADRSVERRRAAIRIYELGFDPWITSPALDEMGVGVISSR